MIQHKNTCLKKEKGFTLLETIVVLSIIAILIGIAIPTFTVWIPGYRLKSAAQDIYSNLQSAKMLAIKENTNKKMIFYTSAGTYRKADGSIVDITAEYEGSVSYGKPAGATDPIYSGADPEVEFSPRGMTTVPEGYIFLKNTKGDYYEIGSLSSGVILLKKWNGSDFE